MSIPDQKEISYMLAIREALQEEMERDPTVFIMGEDLRRHGGGFGVTKELWEKFGDERVINTPISENCFVGAAFCGPPELGVASLLPRALRHPPSACSRPASRADRLNRRLS